MNKPQLVALSALVAGAAFVIGGVYVLAGPGWSMLAASMPCFAVAGVIQRGLRNG